VAQWAKWPLKRGLKKWYVFGMLVTLFFLAGFLVSLAFSIFAYYSVRGAKLRGAEFEANDMIKEAKMDSDAQAQDQKEIADEIYEEMFKRVEKDHLRLAAKNEDYQERLEDRDALNTEKLSSREQALRRRESALQSRRSKVGREESRVAAIRERRQKKSAEYAEVLRSRSNVPAETLKEQVVAKLEEEARHDGHRLAQEIEQNMQVTVEREAKRILSLALNRFARPYCAERGIGNVQFTNPEIKTRVLGANAEWQKLIEKLCGVDIVVNEEYQSASVMGFDPVRRELGRLLLESLTKQKVVDETRINEIYNRAKSELFKKIAVDGNRIANELRLQGMHENVRSMLGALRYRYSFAQNQHFHVAEVGWLAGLLSTELGLPVLDGRRAGVLHDIGKAMDHSKEGGHAVIGAEFIEQHGEVAHIVHAVKAHHFDEQPSTDLAFLTIAADAISGARPGARRSTADSYSQKMADLEKIGSSFPGVTGTYILSAGREVRVTVDGGRIDDHKALELSKDIAKKIEEEANYPGQIKVTVVRETLAVEFAR
jgi:ribonucrease Y